MKNLPKIIRKIDCRKCGKRIANNFITKNRVTPILCDKCTDELRTELDNLRDYAQDQIQSSALDYAIGECIRDLEDEFEAVLRQFHIKEREIDDILNN